MFEVHSDHQREKQGAKNFYVFYNLSSPPESSIKRSKISLTGLTLWLPDGKGCLCTSLHPCVSSWPRSNINQRFKTTRLQLQTCRSGQLRRAAYHLNSPRQTSDFQSFLLLTLREQNGGAALRPWRLSCLYERETSTLENGAGDELLTHANFALDLVLFQNKQIKDSVSWMQSSPYVCNKRKPGRGVGTLLGALTTPSDKEVYLTQTCLRGLFSRCHRGFTTLTDLITK